MQDQKSLTLCWHSFWYWHIHNMLSCNLAWFIINGVMAAFVPSSCTFSFINRLFFNNTYKYILQNIHWSVRWMYIIIHSNIPFHSINAHLHCLVRSIGCCRLQNGCQLHYHAADSVLTSGWSFISQQIWIKIIITLAILGIWIKIWKLSTGKGGMYIHISGWHTFDFGYVSCLIFPRWNKWCFGWMWRWFWCRLSELLWWRCTRAFASPGCLGILHCAMLARKAAVRQIVPKHS